MIGITGTANALDWIYNPATGHEYALTENYDNWLAEEAVAVTQGGHLVTVNDAAENEWLAETFKATYIQNLLATSGGAAFNIGYYLDSASNTWKWISGETPTYTNLYTGWGTTVGTYAYMHTNNHFSPGTWNRNQLHQTYGNFALGVIEREPSSSPVPEPATMLLFGAGIAGLAAVGRRKRS